MENQTQVVIGIYVGKSFAEVSALNIQGDEVAFKRWYTPRENLQNGLKKFLAENESIAPVKVIVASQYLEKLFDFKLGGSVAQLVTRGFEKWCYLKQPTTHSAWKSMNRAPTLSIMDHWIPVSERVSTDGVVEREFSDGELDSTLDYIKAHEVKRICIHFLNSSKNPLNQNKAKEYFEKHGYDVFTPNMHNEEDEVAVFRENTFNASMTGTWEEMCQEIKDSFKDLVPAEQFYFLQGQGLLQDDKNLRWQTLLGYAFAQSKVIPGLVQKKCDVLHLGLEKFELLNTQSECTQWQTPWGPVRMKGPQTHRLKIQPDSLMFINKFGEMDLSPEAIGFEPGPMNFGRGLKPLVFDLFHEQFSNEDEIEGITELLSPAGRTRFINQLTTLAKTSRDQKDNEVDDIISDLKNLCAHQIMNEVLWKMTTNQLVVTGYFSELLREEIQEVFKSIFHIQVKFIDQSDSDLVARFGAAL